MGTENAFEIIFDDAITNKRVAKLFCTSKPSEKSECHTSILQFFENYPKYQLKEDDRLPTYSSKDFFEASTKEKFRKSFQNFQPKNSSFIQYATPRSKDIESFKYQF